MTVPSNLFEVSTVPIAASSYARKTCAGLLAAAAAAAAKAAAAAAAAAAAPKGKQQPARKQIEIPLEEEAEKETKQFINLQRSSGSFLEEVPPLPPEQNSSLEQTFPLSAVQNTEIKKQQLGYHSFRCLLLDRIRLALAAAADPGGKDLLLQGEEGRGYARHGAINIAQQLQDILKVYHVEVSSWNQELQNACPSIGSILHDKGFCKPCVFANKTTKQCTNGSTCCFCHFYHKPKRNRARHSGRRRAGNSNPPAVCTPHHEIKTKPQKERPTVIKSCAFSPEYNISHCCLPIFPNFTKIGSWEHQKQPPLHSRFKTNRTTETRDLTALVLAAVKAEICSVNKPQQSLVFPAAIFGISGSFHEIREDGLKRCACLALKTPEDTPIKALGGGTIVADGEETCRRKENNLRGSVTENGNGSSSSSSSSKLQQRGRQQGDEDTQHAFSCALTLLKEALGGPLTPWLYGSWQP